MNHYRLTIVGAVAFLLLLASGLAIGAELKGLDSQTTPLVTAVFGLIAAAIPALLALLRVEGIHNSVKEQNGQITHLEEVAVAAQETAESVKAIVENGPSTGTGTGGANGSA